GDVERLRELRLRLDERRRDVGRAVELLHQLSRDSATAEVRAALLATARTLRVDAEEAGDIVDALEGGVKSISTVTVMTMLEPMHRMVRDLGHQLGKEVRLNVVGGEVSVDRRVL